MASIADSTDQLEPNHVSLPEVHSLRPIRIFCVITPAGLRRRGIKVLDLTSQMSQEHGDSLMAKKLITEAKRLVKESSPPSPYFTLSGPRFAGRHVAITNSKGDQVAEYKLPFTLHCTAVLTIFSPGSPHSAHQLKIKPVGLGFRAATFVTDEGVRYVWKADSILTTNRFSLYKSSTNEANEIRVGRYARNLGLSPPGVLVLDTREVDEQLGVLTCLVVLMERNAYG
jgi:hypothetical protein